jgi:DNA-binding transcriptional LysR family regulator
MTLKQLEAFYWAVTLGSFAIAAQRLNTTQSALSKRITELEHSLRRELFDRSGKKAIPTEAAKELMLLAPEILRLVDRARAPASEQAPLEGVCRFGISELVALTWLPRLLSLMRERHPALVLQPYVDLALVLERKVARGDLDFAVAPAPGQIPAVNVSVVRRVSFSWSTAPALVPASGILTASELQSMPVITMTEDSGLTRAFNAWCVTHKMQPIRTISCNNLMTIIGLTIAGMGVSFLPEHFIQRLVDHGLLCRCESDPAFPVQDYSFLARGDDNRRLIRVMRDVVEECADFSMRFAGWNPLVW